jgi:hypothetical protein
MRRTSLLGLALFLTTPAWAECTKDADCEADRKCQKGVCTAPTLSERQPDALNASSQDSLIEALTPSESAPNRSGLPSFADYPANRHPGPWILPKGIRRVGPDEWRNEFGKLVGPPEMNFAGRFHISLNSCGTSCRYFTLTDLSSGKDLDLLAPFDSAEPFPRTKDGRTYVTVLISRPDSNLLIAQYLIDPEESECRERYFLFENDKLRPITGTQRKCSSR